LRIPSSWDKNGRPPAEKRLCAAGTRKGALCTASAASDAQPFSSFLPTTGQRFSSGLGGHPDPESLAAFLHQVGAGFDVFFHRLVILCVIELNYNTNKTHVNC